MDDSWGEGKRALKYKVVEEDDDDEEEEEEDEFEEEEEQEGSDDYGDDGRKKRVVMVTAAAAAGSNNNNNNNVCISSKRTTCSSSSKGAGAGGGSSSSSSSCCQVDSCNADLRNAKQYHRRHKVCEYHAKASSVLISHLQQRFCQQCSRFHELGEFDESKRSCRRRLAGHNERRRKNAADYHG